MIINLQNSDTLKIQLTIAINSVSSKDTEEERVIHLSSDNIKFTSYSETNDVIEKLFKLLCLKYQDGLETSMKGSNVIFDLAQLTYCKCHKVYFKGAGSYTDSKNSRKKEKVNKSTKWRLEIFSIRSNCCIKFWRNWITSRKSCKHDNTIYK